ncbi:hypothetical protein EJB05_02738 [Eragrostis curvula]|uniref:Bowman-Birk serine protease inhibitors family domain-containing protein n=1 Tax=Eragrostis curvula TaxID=38414 RepID=A0A5J9WVS6_9POAL|nr:hypothetical protein EJB05_02738 [Eragrostis curvula]
MSMAKDILMVLGFTILLLCISQQAMGEEGVTETGETGEIIDAETVKTLFNLTFLPQKTNVYRRCYVCPCCNGKCNLPTITCCREFTCDEPGKQPGACVRRTLFCGCNEENCH